METCISLTMAKGMTKMATSRSAIAKLTRNMFDSFLMNREFLGDSQKTGFLRSGSQLKIYSFSTLPFYLVCWRLQFVLRDFFDNLRFGSVVTARQTRELPRMEVITNKERSVYIIKIYSINKLQSDIATGCPKKSTNRSKSYKNIYV